MILNAVVTRSLVAPPPTVEEVRGRAAIELDEVHGRHRETGAVHHAADRAIELDVIETVLRGFQLRRILFVGIAEILDVLVAGTAIIVVEVDLGIERQHIAGAGHHQRD